MRIVVAGDSVHWGQGLKNEHKFATSVAADLGAALDLPAHSGATIGADNPADLPAVDPEVPFAHPTIVRQCETFASPGAVDVVLLNGGINDITVQTIISPLTSEEHLRRQITRYCDVDMRVLIERAALTFTRARLLVTSYFPIFSHESDPRRVERVLAAHFIAPPAPFVQLAGNDAEAARAFIFDKVVRQALQFWRESTAALRTAVEASYEGGSAAGRVTFVEVPFTERNAVFAPEPWLFGLNRDLSPQDDVIEERRAACVEVHQGDPFGAWLCSIASVGHPNLIGAQEYAKAILANLR